ncbi:copper amine oxidase N-terminal domain-containing protein [Clostridiaceae bacterium 35-E11]
MKRKISWLLVLALVVSLVPMSVFAASSNSMTKVVKAADDAKFTDADSAPVLKIENDENDFGAKETFKLTLENAEWLSNTAEITVPGVVYGVEAGMEAVAGAKVDVTRVTDTTLEVEVTGAADGETFRFPMFVKLQGKGDTKVTVEPIDSNVTGGVHTFAIGAAGDTKTTVEDTVDFTDVANLETLQIDELSIGTLSGAGKDVLKLKLPSDFEWNNTLTSSNITLKGTGGLGHVAYDTAVAAADQVKVDDRTLLIAVDFGSAKSSTRGTIYIDGLKFSAKKDADFGEVEVTINSDNDNITKEDIVIAEYCDYNVEVKADGEPKEIFAGEYETSATDDAHKLQTLVIEENVANAWLAERKTRIEFPSWVKIRDVDVTSDTANIDSHTIKEGLGVDEQGDNYIEFTADITPNKKGKLYVKFYVSVEAGKSGDITATVDGRSLGEEYEVVLGKAVNPVDVEVKPVADVRTGIKDQEIGEITITENKDEAIKKGDLVLELDDDVEWTEVPEIEVVEGNLDLDVDNAKVRGSVLTIPVDSDSSKPATIKISDMKLDLDRTIAEGDINVQVGGDAIVRNTTEGTSLKLDNGAFKEEHAVETVIARVITPADGNITAGEEVKFVIDSKEYAIGDEQKTADVAPYIADGRTMLSVRYVAEAIGVQDNNIIWNEAARTVTIFKGDRIAQVEIGSNELFVNGVVIPMDTEAVIKDGRTMLPVSFIAKALGLDVQWDGATRTVTIK